MSITEFLGIDEPSTEIVPAERETAVDPDGWIYDTSTGEVIGREDLPAKFEVDDIDKAEWSLELRSKLEGDIAAIDIRLAAVREQLQAIRREKLRRLSWWDWKFGDSLKAFARSQLGKKSKTAQFAWGKVSFRTTAGNNEIMDMEAAVEWMKVWKPAKVKVTEKVGVKDVLATIQEVAEISGEKPEKPPWLISSDSHENVTISTGIEIKSIEGSKS